MELKKYLQDRPILFLNITVFFLAFFNILSTLLRVDSSRAAAIVRYMVWKQDSFGGIQGSVYELYSFAVLVLILTIGGFYFGYKLYRMNRNYGLITLTLVIICLIFNIIVSNAILNLQ